MQNLAPTFLLFFLLHASFFRSVDPENITQLAKAVSHLLNGEEIHLKRPKDCGDIDLLGHTKSGVHMVWPLRNIDRKGFPVYCDLDEYDGGWMVIHRRNQSEVPKWYFRRSWREYKKGFGDLDSWFWLGNDLINEVTSQDLYDLRLVVRSGTDKIYSDFDSFFIGDEEDYYKLYLGNYLPGGTGGDMIRNSNGKNFTTRDRNNLPLITSVVPSRGRYPYSSINVTQEYQSTCARDNVGWWYSSNCEVDPNMRTPTTIMEMMIRPKWYVHVA